MIAATLASMKTASRSVMIRRIFDFSVAYFFGVLVPRLPLVGFTFGFDDQLSLWVTFGAVRTYGFVTFPFFDTEPLTATVGDLGFAGARCAPFAIENEGKRRRTVTRSRFRKRRTISSATSILLIGAGSSFFLPCAGF
jgi:hypothetical protein